MAYHPPPRSGLVQLSIRRTAVERIRAAAMRLTPTHLLQVVTKLRLLSACRNYTLTKAHVQCVIFHRRLT